MNVKQFRKHGTMTHLWLRLLLAGCLSVLASPAWAVTYDTTANGVCGQDGFGGLTACTATHTVLTYAITVGANSNRQLSVWVFISCGGGNTPPALSSLTYAGQALTQIATASQAASNLGYLYTWPTGSQPTTGTNNVVATVASSLETACPNATKHHALSSGAVSAYNVNQSTTLSSFNSATGLSTTGAVTISTSGANDLGIHAACHGTGWSSTTETSRWTQTNTHESCGSDGGATAAGGDVNFSWTSGSSDTWVMIGAAFKDVDSASPHNLSLMGVGR